MASSGGWARDLRRKTLGGCRGCAYIALLFRTLPLSVDSYVPVLAIDVGLGPGPG
jgi:hypothetical protein